MDYIIIAIIAFVIVTGLLRGRKHFSGGGCCGGGSNTIRDKKSLSDTKLGEKIMTIDGMHCENCEIRIENALNRIDGAACKVNWKKKNAVVSYSKEISDRQLKETVEKLGYTVTDIR